ncbi:Lysine acetyltransferase [Pseudocercospora fuligena]|uniref:Lysine acetyltransferase n=1 Tax=Pseudocercospora fuligena TaxID=685502 RepID=A0A8H6RSY4_9PEZI|nr:Lysine acetyltransferase [Pseudocercospora fuligena]
MGSTGLPDRLSPNLRLAQATEEEWLAQQLVNSDEWKGVLSLESYLKREKHLFSQDLTRDGGITGWVLIWEPDANGQRTVLCGCETINKRAFAARQGKVEEVISHGVASVYCPAQYRGKGYAGRMMAELGDRINSWQTDNGKPALFSVLFSDIGKDFYAARGWHPFPSAHVLLPVAESSTPNNVKLLKSRDLPELCAYDEKLLHHRMSQIKPSSRTTVAIVPDVRHAAWHHAREEFVANEIHGKVPDVKGAMVGDKKGSRVWAYWTRVWANPQERSPSTLHILRLVIEDDVSSDFAPADVETAKSMKDSHVARAISSIFTVAQSEASRWDMREVMLWNPSSAALAAAQLIDPNAAVEHRETESITSLRWYGEGSWKDVDWICNEKYEWC